MTEQELNNLKTEIGLFQMNQLKTNNEFRGQLETVLKVAMGASKVAEETKGEVILVEGWLVKELSRHSDDSRIELVRLADRVVVLEKPAPKRWPFRSA